MHPSRSISVVVALAALNTVGCSCESTGDDDTQNQGGQNSGGGGAGGEEAESGGSAGAHPGGEGGAPSGHAGEAGEAGAAADGGASGGLCGDEPECDGICCGADEHCAAEARCVPDQPKCDSNDDCQHDTFCRDDRCVPYDAGDEPGFDEDCQVDASLSKMKPVQQCHWQEPPDADPYPTHVQVMATPMVADLGLDDDPDNFRPSIVFPTFAGGNYTGPGYVRVISGDDCTQQLTTPLAEDAVSAIAPVALADLTGDGLPEVVAAAQNGGVLAFRVSEDGKALERLWRSATCAESVRTPDVTGGNGRWSGPSVVDLTDDGVPEVVYGATVYDAEGCILSSALGFMAYSQGIVPVLADIDDDGKVELIEGNGLYEWDRNSDAWVAEPAFVTTGLTLGQVAVAELGEFPLAAVDDKDFPEIVVVSSGYVRVQTIAGRIVFGPYPIPGGGVGGAPTIADFDGDGRPEIGTAGGRNYAVFDLDCVPGGEAERCATERIDGILWAQASQDASSNVTGSSVFDFDADGNAEVAYADECFLRIYEGATGTVVASVGNTSGTTYENPVIADTDGDFRSEIVIAANDYYAPSLGCPAMDPLFPSAAGAVTRGVFVFRDEDDAWAASRPIWNQHAYSVVNVTDRGVIPRTRDVAANWKDEDLNNFRQNTQGGLSALGLGDLTVSDGGSDCDDDATILKAKLCNRGTLPVPAGVEVAFLDDDRELCLERTEAPLGSGECTVLSCALNQSVSAPSFTLLADPENTQLECHDENNEGRTLPARCD
jgi:hypothetical protein